MKKSAFQKVRTLISKMTGGNKNVHRLEFKCVNSSYLQIVLKFPEGTVINYPYKCCLIAVSACLLSKVKVVNCKTALKGVLELFIT